MIIAAFGVGCFVAGFAICAWLNRRRYGLSVQPWDAAAQLHHAFFRAP